MTALSRSRRTRRDCLCRDFEKELARIAKEKENCLKQIALFESKLSNEAFVSRAPEKVVNDQKEKLAKNQALLAQLIESEKRLKK